MQLVWLCYGISTTSSLKKLSERCYQQQHSTYPQGLNHTQSNLYSEFLLPPHDINNRRRAILAVYDSRNMLRAAVGVSELQSTPAWLLSWVISDLKSAEFITTWAQLISKLCRYFESLGRKEFYTVTPESRTRPWLRLMQPVLDRYDNSVQRVVAAGARVDFPLYWSMMGHSTFDYPVKINLFVLNDRKSLTT